MKLLLFLLLFAAPLSAQTVDQFLGIPSPLELAVAKKADRLAWVTYDRGLRNVYTAAAPTWTARRITSFLKDEGQELGDVSLSNDGRIAVFVRGTDPNDNGWIANPLHAASGVEREIWAANTATAQAWKLVATNASPLLSPDGSVALYVKDGQIYRVRTARGVARDSMDRGLKPFIRQWGTQASPRWSPDGKKIAFVSLRGDHSYIGIYDLLTRKVDFVAPGVDCDGAPTWSRDGKQIAFIRRPGAPFGLELGAGNARVRGCAALYRWFSQPPSDSLPKAGGLYGATFTDDSRFKIMIADVGKQNNIYNNSAHELWHNEANDKDFVRVNRMMWADGHIVFPLSPLNDEWDRYYSISLTNPTTPTLLTTTNGFIEDATSTTLSRDGRTLYYSTNANDIERRHIWSVPVAGGKPVPVSVGDGVETTPVALSSGIAVLHFGAKQPASVALVSMSEPKIIYPQLPATFPATKHVEPEIILTKAADGLEIHNQLFLPPDLKPGEKRPAIVFVHGGPMRQMMPAYHYMQFYHWAYGVNQWLANQGYVVISVNYRLGVGYGRSFRAAGQKGGSRGNAEYQDVLAAGRYLQTRSDVDSSRIGIWGLSYGGLLTAHALANNSDLFKVGVDMAGVHLWGSSLDTASVSYKSSPIAYIDKWTSPVLLVQGDDDRNVEFSQTVGLVQLLRAHNIPHEMIIIPDDTHESLIYDRWMYTWNRMLEFLNRYLKPTSTTTSTR